MRVDRKEEMFRLKGSKYVQAKTGNIFDKVKNDLEAGKIVLFSGTACHIDGLKCYIGKDLARNLITCDIVCHGVPSPKVYKDYLRYIETENGDIAKFDFRDKSYGGWHKSVESYKTRDGKDFVSDDYASIFYTNYCLRESCYVCKYADFNRVSDVTVADFWGIERVYPDMDDDKGVSLLLVNSIKGKELFESVIPNIECRGVKPEQCKQHNLIEPTLRPRDTAEFWADYYDKDFRYILRKYAQKRMAVVGNMTVLSNWINMIKENVKLSSYFVNSNKRKVAVCGDAKNNQLLINNLMKDSVEIVAIIDMYQEYKENVNSVIAVTDVKEFVEQYLVNTDVIVITDETHCVDIMDELVKAGVALSKIMPMSFITTLEV